MANTTTNFFRNLCLLTLIYKTLTKTKENCKNKINQHLSLIVQSFLANGKHYSISLLFILSIMHCLHCLLNVKWIQEYLFQKYFWCVSLGFSLGCCLHSSSSSSSTSSHPAGSSLPQLLPATHKDSKALLLLSLLNTTFPSDKKKYCSS